MNYTLSLRIVVGWTYFSAFWRRLILENKLDPDAAGYIGIKFNNFLPHALIQSPIEFLVSSPDLLWWTMLVFTIVEGIVGLLFMLGLLTRFMALLVTGLALGILLSAGWIGTTCLDEWQIGILGMVGGITIFFFGSDRLSLDNYFKLEKYNSVFEEVVNQKTAFVTALLMLVLTLGTNQIFHGGVWGTLHNKSVSPELEISQFKTQNNSLAFDVMRVEGADVYGSFVYQLELIDPATKRNIYQVKGQEWQAVPIKVKNHYIARIKTHKFSLLVPLGAKATIEIPTEIDLPGKVILKLTDINGKSWSVENNLL